jgi:hypothetical protein
VAIKRGRAAGDSRWITPRSAGPLVIWPLVLLARGVATGKFFGAVTVAMSRAIKKAGGPSIDKRPCHSPKIKT